LSAVWWWFCATALARIDAIGEFFLSFVYGAVIQLENLVFWLPLLQEKCVDSLCFMLLACSAILLCMHDLLTILAP
jgi:hypothetical protein